MAQAFAPVLAKNGGGAFINVLSAASWINSGAMTAYAVSKAAAWSLTNGLRNELRQQGTQVLGLHVGFVETDLTRGLDVVKVSPQSVVNAASRASKAALTTLCGETLTTSSPRVRSVSTKPTCSPRTWVPCWRNSLRRPLVRLQAAALE